jgi:signal peptidase II
VEKVTPKTAWIAGSVIVIDQATKTLARLLLPLCERAGTPSCDPVEAGVLRFLRYPNGGSALGFAQGQMRWTILALSGAAITFLFASRRPGTLLLAATSLQFAGAVSNLVDRVAFGAVTDFLVMGPLVINIADLALVAGTAIAVVVLLTEPNQRPDQAMREEVSSI